MALPYGYKCLSCNKYFEVVKDINDAGRLEYCPDCHSHSRRCYDSILSEKTTFTRTKREPIFEEDVSD